MAISYNWLFQWNYTFYKWGFLRTYKWYNSGHDCHGKGQGGIHGEAIKKPEKCRAYGSYNM